MLAARYKFSPRTIPGIFARSRRSKKSGYSILVLPKEESGGRYAVVLASSAARTAIQRHAIKRSVYQLLEQWVASGAPDEIEKQHQAFFLIVQVMDWNRAQPQLHTQDWKDAVEYLLQTSNTP